LLPKAHQLSLPTSSLLRAVVAVVAEIALLLVPLVLVVVQGVIAHLREHQAVALRLNLRLMLLLAQPTR
jgi:hypothetical protein